MSIKIRRFSGLFKVLSGGRLKNFFVATLVALVGLGVSFVVGATGNTISVEVVKKHLGETFNGTYLDRNYIYLWYGSNYANGTGGVGTTDTTLNHTYYFHVNSDGARHDAVCLQPTVSYSTINNDTGTETVNATAYDSSDGANYEKLKLVLMATTVPAFSSRTYGSYSWSDLVGMVSPPASGDFYYTYGGMGYKHPSAWGLESYLVGHVLGGMLFSANSSNSGYYYIPNSATAAFDATLNAIISDATLLAQAQNYTLYITENGANRQSLGFVKQTSSTPTYEQSGIELCKVDGSQNPILDAGTAQFTITLTHSGATNTYTVATTVADGRNCTAQYVVDTGTTFTYTETVAPTGYNLDATQHSVTSSTTAGTTITVPVVNTKTATPTTGRGDLEFVKYRTIVTASNPDGPKSLAEWAYKQFTITNGTQTATLTADATGKVSTCDDTTIWFGAGSRPAGAGCQGALPAGQYTVTEVSSSDGVYADNQSWTVTVADGAVASINANGSAVNNFSDEPVLTTAATDFYATDNSDNTIVAAADQSIVDRVCYSGLSASATYQLWGFVYEVGSSARPGATPATQVNSGKANAITYGIQHITNKASGCVDVIMNNFDATAYAGKTLGVIQYLYRTSTEFNDTGFGILESVHNYALSESSETINVVQPQSNDPAIASTTAAAVLGYGNTTENKLFVGKTRIADTVVLANTTSGTTYYLEAQLVDANGASIPLLNATNGAKINGAHREACTAAGTTATCNVEIEFDSVAYQGQTVTVYESLFVGDATTPISTHKVLGESSQSIDVYNAEMATFAKNPADNTQTVGVGVATIEDAAHYYNLIPQEAYRITGELYTLNGQKVATTNTSAHDFTASAASGSETVSFTFDSSAYAGQTLVVFETITRNSDGVEVASHKATNAANQQIRVAEAALDDSTATFAAGAKNVDASAGSVTVFDSVSYTGLVAGSNYTVVAKLYKLNNGVADTSTELLTKSAAFTPTSDAGSQNIELGALNVSARAGEEFVVYDYLYFGSTLVAKHEENVNDQIISVNQLTPAITSTVASAGTNSGIDGKLRIGNAKISDQVAYANLNTSASYVLKGALYHYKSDTANATLIAGSEVTRNFTPFAATGNETMEFSLNTVSYIGETIVVYEYLYASDGTTLLSSHASASHASQSLEVTTPLITTSATNPANGASRTIPVAMTSGINDAVVIDGFVPNDTNQYTLTGGVYKLTDTQTPMADSVTKTGQMPGADGKIVASMDFSLDTSALQGVKLVVWQDLFYGDATIASEHLTAEDSEQVVTVDTLTPTMATTAYYGENSKITPADPRITIYDKVSLSGLVLGADDYTLTTELVKADGSRVELRNANSDKTKIVTELGVISATSFDKVIDITFNAADYAGQTLTVLQTLKKGDEEIVKHADVADQNQQVTVAEAPAIIKTIAKDLADGDHTLAVNTRATIVDKVEYAGLVSGATYALSGKLIDKNTQKLLTAEGVVEATIYFTPEESEGYVEMEFEVNTAGLSGKSIVVFERLTREYEAEDDEEPESVLVAAHEDIDADDQTVNVSIAIPDTGLFGKDDSSADATRGAIAIIAGAVVCMGSAVILRKRLRLRK